MPYEELLQGESSCLAPSVTRIGSGASLSKIKWVLEMNEGLFFFSLVVELACLPLNHILCLKRNLTDFKFFLLVVLCAQYADPVSDLLDKWGAFRCRLFRESCVFHRGNYVKDLSRLGRDLNKVIIVDNSPASYIFHPDNAVCLCISIYSIFSFFFFFLVCTCTYLFSSSLSVLLIPIPFYYSTVSRYP